MANVHDVAAYLLRNYGRMDTWKLQKLVYYCQAWHLVWEGQPLFPERIEAWANGPVVRVLYQHHRGAYTVSDWPLGSPAQLSSDERESIDIVAKHYGHHTGHWLRERTHQEAPWRAARAGLPADARSDREITLDSMLAYYGSLQS